MSTIYYFAPDFKPPSWGVGTIYHHVDILIKNGFRASLLHEKRPFRVPWLDLDVPIGYVNGSDFIPTILDLLIVSELCATEPWVRDFPGRRLVFVQGSFMTLRNQPAAVDYTAQGFTHAIAIMPHVEKILKNHYNIDATVIPPFIDPAFFVHNEREKRQCNPRLILVFPKAGYQKAGYPDLDIVTKLLNRKSESDEDWCVVELREKSRAEMARLMRAATFLVNVNCLEAFNTTVPEAMAAGCIPICYEAFGGRDYLVDGYNSYMFPNNHVYPLVDKLFWVMDNYETNQEEFTRIRQGALDTAMRFTIDQTEQALIAFYRQLLI